MNGLLRYCRADSMAGNATLRHVTARSLTRIREGQSFRGGVARGNDNHPAMGSAGGERLLVLPGFPQGIIRRENTGKVLSRINTGFTGVMTFMVSDSDWSRIEISSSS